MSRIGSNMNTSTSNKVVRRWRVFERRIHRHEQRQEGAYIAEVRRRLGVRAGWLNRTGIRRFGLADPNRESQTSEAVLGLRSHGFRGPA